MYLFLGVKYTLLKAGAECDSSDEWLGKFSNVQECADECASKPKCQFFIYGTDVDSTKCYWEKTSSGSCPEGWDSDTYDFYKLGTPGKCRWLIMYHTNKQLSSYCSF